MQTIKIKINIINLSNGEGDVSVSELRRVISEHPELLKEERKSFGERMIGKEYWFIDGYGIKTNDGYWCNNSYDHKRLSVNNAFFTESDCDKEIEIKLALGRIMSYIRDNEIELVKDEDWKNDDILKWQIDGWDYIDDTPNIDSSYNTNWSQFSLTFYSQEDREKVVENCKEDLEILLKK
jgi:hypothetical protein